MPALPVLEKLLISEITWREEGWRGMTSKESDLNRYKYSVYPLSENAFYAEFKKAIE